MKIVFFYVDLPTQVTHVSDGTKNADLVSIMIQSVRKNIPTAKIVQLSDNNTQRIDNVDEYYTFGEFSQYLMPTRLDYQARYLMHRCGIGEHVAFVDPDVIFQDDINPMFDDDFDIGLTWRDNMGQLSESMPFNTGIVLTKNSQQAQQFWDNGSKAILAANEQIKTWYGDQLFIANAIGIANYESRTSDFITNNGINFKVFPCQQYNYSPINDEPMRIIANTSTDDCETMVRLKNKTMLHFKGGLKDIMAEYWNKFK